MCRYAIAGPYKNRYACFICCKAFKRRAEHDLPRRMQSPGGQPKQVRCPNCRALMHDMGKDFKAPPKENSKQWKKVELLFLNGVTFHDCGCGGPGPMPVNIKEVEAFLHATLPRSKAQKLLDTIRNRPLEKHQYQRSNGGHPTPELSGCTWGHRVRNNRRPPMRSPVKPPLASQFAFPSRKRIAGP